MLSTALINGIYASKTSALKKPNKQQLLDEQSTEIVIGSVISKESKWVNTSTSHLVYTFAKIKLNKTERTSTIKSNNIKVFYEGGILRNYTIMATRCPWGEIDIPDKGLVKLYLVKTDQLYGYKYYVLGAEPLEEEPMMTIRSSGTTAIREEMRVKFEWYPTWKPWSYTQTWYFIENSVPGYLDEDDCQDAIEDATETWEDEAYSVVSFIYGGTRASQTLGNAYSEVGFADLAGNLIALNTRYPNNDGWTENDIQFNTDYDWCFGANEDEYDAQSIAPYDRAPSA